MRPEDPLHEDLALEAAARRLDAAERALGRGEAVDAPLAGLDWLEDADQKPSGLVLPPMISAGGLWVPSPEAGEAADPFAAGLKAWRERLSADQRQWPRRTSVARRWHDQDAFNHRHVWLTADTPPQRQLHAETFAAAVEAASTEALDAFDEHPPALHPTAAVMAERLLDATDDVARDVVGLVPYAELIPLALARDADAGWPRVRDGWAERLFQPSGLLDGLALPARQLSPAVWGASTYARDLGELGVAVLQAGRPASVPFVLHRAADGAREATRRRLFADLVRSEPWLQRHLSLGRERARVLRRALARASLVEVRLRAAALLGQEALREGVGAARERYADLGPRLFSDRAPLLGALPRVHPRAGARLHAIFAAHQQAKQLRERHDEDWFRNPRAAEALRSTDARAEDEPLPDDPRAWVDGWVETLEAELT